MDNDTPGMSEAREALEAADRDIARAVAWERLQREGGWGTPVRHLRAVLTEVTRLTAERDALMDAFTEVFGRQDGTYLEQLSAMRRGIASLCADIDRAARGDKEGRVPDAPRTTTLGALASVRELRARWVEAVVERDAARDETQRLWAATEADRARMAELEARPTWADGVREALYVACPRRRGLPDTALPIDRTEVAILALLEPKT